MTTQDREKFDVFKKRSNPKYHKTDDSVSDRLDWELWQAALQSQQNADLRGVFDAQGLPSMVAPAHTTGESSGHPTSEPFKALSDDDILWIAKSHGIDVSTCNVLGFYTDLISTTPVQAAAEPPQYRAMWLAVKEELDTLKLRGGNGEAEQPGVATAPSEVYEAEPPHPIAEPVSWKTYIDDGFVKFQIGNQSFRIDFTPDKDGITTEQEHLEWMRSMLDRALSKLSAPPATHNRDAVVVNLMRLANINKHLARDIADAAFGTPPKEGSMSSEITKAYRAGFADGELASLTQKGAAAWKDVPNATEWVDELRGQVEDPVSRLNETIERINLDREHMRAAMRLALSMLHFMNDNGYRLEEYEQGRMDAAIAALEKECK